jgi:hypothetical protein
LAFAHPTVWQTRPCANEVRHQPEVLAEHVANNASFRALAYNRITGSIDLAQGGAGAEGLQSLNFPLTGAADCGSIGRMVGASAGLERRHRHEHPPRLSAQS